MNTQPIEKKDTREQPYLDVVDVFHTIQGEGPYTGHRAIFVRLAGCNLQCPACDTDYTSTRKTCHISELFDKVARLAHSRSELVVITGGEPFRQNITAFANTLVSMGYKVQVETNGTLPPSKGLSEEVTIVCSPKAGKINSLLAERANCFKYVMDWESVDPDDGLPVLALEHGAYPRVARPPAGNTKPIYLQPCDSKNTAQNHRNVAAVTTSCMKHGYILQLQIHKLIGVE